MDENALREEEELKLAVGLICDKWLPELQFSQREFETWASDGYGSESERSWFFCLKGSPNKLCGFVQRAGGRPSYQPWKIETNAGKFYYARNQVRKRDWIVPAI